MFIQHTSRRVQCANVPQLHATLPSGQMECVSHSAWYMWCNQSLSMVHCRLYSMELWTGGFPALLLHCATVHVSWINDRVPCTTTVATLLTLPEVNHVEFKTSCPLLEQQHSWFRPVQKISDWCTYRNMTHTMTSITTMSWMLKRTLVIAV